MATSTKKIKFAQVWYVEIVKNEEKYYLLLLGDGGETPFFSASNKIVFCKENAIAVIKNYCNSKYFKILMGDKPVFKIDEKELFDIILNNDVDKKSLILNTLNVLFDCAKTIGQDVDKEYRKSLYPIADHLTFDKKIKDFFLNNGVERIFVKNEIERLIKFIWSNKVVISLDNEKGQMFKYLFRFIFLFEKAQST